jgi:hypothetical protein
MAAGAKYSFLFIEIDLLNLEYIFFCISVAIFKINADF